MVGWVPYIAVIPELPPHQRALGASVIAFTCGTCEYAGSVLGVAIGKHWMSNDVRMISWSPNHLISSMIYNDVTCSHAMLCHVTVSCALSPAGRMGTHAGTERGEHFSGLLGHGRFGSKLMQPSLVDDSRAPRTTTATGGPWQIMHGDCTLAALCTRPFQSDVVRQVLAAQQQL